MQRLECPISKDAWGSRTAIASIQGRPVPSPTPEAELWVGAHPAAPSTVAGTPLTERIAADPVGILGPEVVGRFGPRLPFLMKLLAAEAPLSLQAHPDAQQAAAGHAAEEAAGVPLHAPHRHYVDPYHKPELVVAVSRFRALCGFRDPAVSADLLAGLRVPALSPVVAALRDGDLAGATERLLTGGSAPVAEVVAAAKGLTGPYEVVGELAVGYPHDPAVIMALMLNDVSLAPGEAIFMPAGNLHAYLSGTAVEIMAASDNVLRGGLTAKYVDAAELMRVVRFDVLTEPMLPPVPVGPGLDTWPVPVAEFALHRVRLEDSRPVRVPVRGPRAVLCVGGEVSVDDGVAVVTLGGGEAGFGGGGLRGSAEAPEVDPFTLVGRGEAFIASLS